MAKQFDVVVVGAGPGGYVAAIRCAQLGLKTACIEKRGSLGGTCLNVGCIPSKTLLHSTELLSKIRREGKLLGIEGERVEAHFPRMMERKQEVIRSLNEGIKALFKKNQISHFAGAGSFSSSHSITVSQGATKEEIEGKSFILATGSEPTPLAFLPFDERRVLSSTGALSLDKVPRKMVVVGAGVIGVELGSVYSRLGTEVIFVEFLDRVCPTLDPGLSKALLSSLTKQGMQFHLSSKVMGADISSKEIHLQVETSDKSSLSLQTDTVLVSIGRRPYTQGLALDKAGIVVDAKGLIPVDGQFRALVPHIYAIGDIIDGPMLAHKASEEGIVVAEIIAGQSPSLDYLAIPNVVYTSPEVASVGLSEAEAKNLGFSVLTGQCSFSANPRAKCSAEEEGFVKILADAATDTILGIHIIGPHASELIAEGCLAFSRRVKVKELSSVCHAHPTLSEVLKEAALSIHKKAIHK